MIFASQPTIAELLDDSLIQAVMRADGVKRGELEILLADAAAKLSRAPRARSWSFHPAHIRFPGEVRPAAAAPVAPRARDCEPCFCV